MKDILNEELISLLKQHVKEQENYTEFLEKHVKKQENYLSSGKLCGEKVT
ncbi:MAG: hypothetical protein ACYYK0_02720 [Candidatus Eutrophobiaceae bacterium]